MFSKMICGVLPPVDSKRSVDVRDHLDRYSVPGGRSLRRSTTPWSLRTQMWVAQLASYSSTNHVRVFLLKKASCTLEQDLHYREMSIF